MGLCSENAAWGLHWCSNTAQCVHTQQDSNITGDKISWNHRWIYELSLTKVIQHINILVITLIGYKISSWRIRFCCINIQNGQWVLSSKKKKTLSDSNRTDIWHSVSQFWRGYTDYSNICLKPKQLCVFT